MKKNKIMNTLVGLLLLGSSLQAADKYRLAGGQPFEGEFTYSIGFELDVGIQNTLNTAKQKKINSFSLKADFSGDTLIMTGDSLDYNCDSIEMNGLLDVSLLKTLGVDMNACLGSLQKINARVKQNSIEKKGQALFEAEDLSEEFLFSQIYGFLPILPEKPVSVGDSWEVLVPANDLEENLQVFMQLLEVNGSFATVSMTMDLDIPNASDGISFISHLTGEMKVDLNTGLVLSQDLGLNASVEVEELSLRVTLDGKLSSTADWKTTVD